MQEWLQSIVESQQLPWLSAFALGLLTAISPCPLATNITATAYIAKGFSDKRMVLWKGVLYTFGRAFSYVMIAVIIFFGASKFHIARFVQGNGEKWLGPVLIIIGLLMLNLIPFPWKSWGFAQKFTEKINKKSVWGAFLLGVLFALAFCPYSGALYFGMLIPMTIHSTDSVTLPLIFAIGTGLPVLVFTYLLAYSMEKVSVWFKVLQKVERVIRYIAGAVFIVVGIYYILIFAGALN